MHRAARETRERALRGFETREVAILVCVSGTCFSVCFGSLVGRGDGECEYK